MTGQWMALPLLRRVLAAVVWLAPALATAQDVPQTEFPPQAVSPPLWPQFGGFQASYTVLPDNALSLGEGVLSGTAELPLLGNWAPLRLTPTFAIRSWSGPDSPDLPPQIYDLSFDIGWRPRLAEWLFLDVGVTPGLYTDFAQVDGDAFRLRGRALGIVAFSRELQVVAGGLYVNRLRTSVIPAGGVLWSPDEATRLELVFPQPRLSRRLLARNGTEWWGYVSGEFGGGTWQIERASGASDLVDYRDLRVLAGVEHVGGCGVKWFAEAGYAFGRTLDYDGPTPDYRPGDAIVLRAGVRY